ncbi:hypothetical protein Mpet_2326 [Methanolacinia petrolearia DSM 11571]|uniref:Antitoxin n=1 Tax=Methanolacinia petrolearia (strain DSM 11571 / OCM 486 / SEBR 4847) TaxID=679926 RepID=E1RD90_METP4|nr:hypothetical protein [Methanolacinia petrolearia]ADN37073.1 hypothetical protein Mpet_2326 [Methanolacinia petrolearia DSM 11571]
MQDIKVSNAVYNEILSRKKAGETISKTLERELKPKGKSKALQELESIGKGKFYKRSEVEKMI